MRIPVRLELRGSTAQAEALGRSKGGYTTRIHAITDALGNPLDFILTGGQASDIGQAAALLQLTPSGASALPGDKGYDRDALVEAIQKQGRQPVIPPRSNRVAPRNSDWFVYKKRHLIAFFLVKSNITGEWFHDLKSSPEIIGASSASFLLWFGCDEMSTEPRQSMLKSGLSMQSSE